MQKFAVQNPVTQIANKGQSKGYAKIRHLKNFNFF